MTVRIRTQIIVVASLDADEKRKQFERQDTTLTTVIDTFDLEQSGELELGAGETNYTLEKGKIITGQYLYVETDRELMIRFDGEATGHRLGAPAVGTKAKMCWRTSFVSPPILTNLDGTNPAQVSYLIAGTKI